MKRVLLTLGAGGFGALILAAMLPPDTVIGAAILCLTASLLAFCLPTVRRHSRAYGAGLLAAGVALCLFAKKELSDYRPAVARAGASVWIEATITEPPVVADEQLFCEVRVLSGDLKPGTRLAYGMPWDDEAPAIGDTVTGTVWLGVTESAETDPTAYFGDKASGVYLTAWQQLKGAVTVRSADPGGASASSAGEPLGVFLRAFRQRAQTGLTAAMPEDARALVSAICLGDRAELSDTVTEAFRRSGVSHLLVVSGLHVSLVALGAYTLLRRMRCRKRIAAVAALATLVLFGGLIGWRASVVRACVLLAAVLLGRCFRRPADSLNSLGGGLLVLWLHDPFCVYDLGLWLSFGATAGLILLYPWLWKRVSDRLPETGFRSRAARVCFPFIRSAVRVVCITLAATLPTLPLTACFFGEI
ncbi:MAG: ComEC/Rec2 family competence protein, partial [Clostridia bacterium]|nr:ComEC/Rec2 family competence protein [Clostridia bacterium]